MNREDARSWLAANSPVAGLTADVPPEWTIDALIAATAAIEAERDVAVTIKNNFATAVDAANSQLEQLYADAAPVMTDAMLQHWKVRIDAHLAAISQDHQVFSYGVALELLQHGYRVARLGWNGKGQWVALQVPDEGSKMTLPYSYISTAQGGLVPWICSQTDALAQDWTIVKR